MTFAVRVRFCLFREQPEGVPPMIPQAFLPMGGLLSALPAPPMAMFQQNMRPDARTFQPFQPQQSYGPCFNCNQAGHSARNCPLPQRSARRNADLKIEIWTKNFWEKEIISERA